MLRLFNLKDGLSSSDVKLKRLPPEYCWDET